MESEKTEPYEIQLKNTQEWMQGALIRPYSMLASLNVMFPDKEAQNSIDIIVKPSSRMSSAEHFAIYQRSYLGRLRDCMTHQFSALNYALGDALFQQFADHYLSNYPSTSYTLADLGEKFMDYLQATRPDKDTEEKEDWPDFMIELAQFEYDINAIFDVNANEDFSFADENTPEERIKLIPVFEVFEHNFPIAQYYREFLNENNPDLPFPETSHSVVFRKNYKLGLYSIKEDQFHFLSFLKQGKSIGETKNAMVKTFHVDPEQMEQVWNLWKTVWLKEGFFQVV